jgi:thioredoxin reductase
VHNFANKDKLADCLCDSAKNVNLFKRNEEEKDKKYLLTVFQTKEKLQIIISVILEIITSKDWY